MPTIDKLQYEVGSLVCFAFIAIHALPGHCTRSWRIALYGERFHRGFSVTVFFHFSLAGFEKGREASRLAPVAHPPIAAARI